jgi:hypothetical protein
MDMNEDTDQLEMIRRAVFGKQVEAFLNSEIGQYLLARALAQKYNAQAEFATVDCAQVELVRKLQNDINQANDIARWLAQAVDDGVKALSIIEDRS